MVLFFLLLGKSIFASSAQLSDALDKLFAAYIKLSGMFAGLAAVGLFLGVTIWPAARHFVEQLVLVLVLLILLAVIWPDALSFIAQHQQLTIGVFVAPNILYYVALRTEVIDRLFHFDPLYRDRTIHLDAPREAVWRAITMNPTAAGENFQKTLTAIAEGDGPGQFDLTHEWRRNTVIEKVEVIQSIPPSHLNWRSRFSNGTEVRDCENTVDLVEDGTGTRVIWRQVYPRPDFRQLLIHYLDDDLADKLALLRHRVDGVRDRSLLSATTRTRRRSYQTGSMSPSAR